MPLAENAAAWEVFGHCGTQWTYAPAGPGGCWPTGLPAERVEARARACKVTIDAEFLWRFGLLETTALDAMRE